MVGWATSARLDRTLVGLALTRALAVRGSVRLHHSDQGRAYPRGTYRARPAAAVIVMSLSRRGNCYDNAVAERFFAAVKRELLDRQVRPTRAATTGALARYIDGYNPRRRHFRLGYRRPVAFEQQLALAA